jgi:histidine triad (HIT) family protein
MDNCLFCKIVRKEIPAHIIYEDADVVAFLDIKPVHPGHTLVVPKIHSSDLNEMDPVDTQAVFSTAQRITHALLRLGAEGANVTTNVKQAGGQVIFHTHVHVIPRYSGDGLHHWPQQAYKEGEDRAWQEKLRSALK